MGNKDKIVAVSKALRDLADSIDEALGEKAETEAAAAEGMKADEKVEIKEVETETGAEEKKPDEPKYTLADVRKVLAAKSGAGYTDDVRELLKKYGASRLSAVSEDDYPALMKEAEEIGTAQ